MRHDNELFAAANIRCLENQRTEEESARNAQRMSNWYHKWRAHLVRQQQMMKPTGNDQSMAITPVLTKTDKVVLSVLKAADECGRTGMYITDICMQDKCETIAPRVVKASLIKLYTQGLIDQSVGYGASGNLWNYKP